MKRRLQIIISSCIIMASGSGGYYIYRHQDFTPEYKDNIILEYGDRTIDVHDLLKSTKDNEHIQLQDVSSFDSLNENSQEIDITLQKKDRIKNDTIAIEVKDTQEPIIELAQDLIEVETGDTFEPSDNIVSVHDPVDGRIEHILRGSIEEYRMFMRNRMRKSNCVFIGSDMDIQTPGNYDVYIISYDRASNMAMRNYTVCVKQTNPKERMYPQVDSPQYDSARWQKDYPQTLETTNSAIYDSFMPGDWIPIDVFYDDYEHIYSNYQEAFSTYLSLPVDEKQHWQIQIMEGLLDNQGNSITCYVLVNMDEKQVNSTMNDALYEAFDEMDGIDEQMRVKTQTSPNENLDS